MAKRGWKAFEAEVAEMLGLDTTIASGNKFHDPGDAVTRGHSPFPLYAEAKYTDGLTFSLRAAALRQWTETAQETGRRFVLPLRFWPYADPAPADYVVLSLHDFAELLEGVRHGTQEQ